MVGAFAVLGFVFVGFALVGSSDAVVNRFLTVYPLLGILAVGGAAGVSGWIAHVCQIDTRKGCSEWIAVVLYSLIMSVLLTLALVWVNILWVVREP